MENFFPSLNNIPPSVALKPLDHHEIRISISSNWGNQEFVACTCIEILDVNHRIIIPVRQRVPGYLREGPKLGDLFTSCALKHSARDIWRYSWTNYSENDPLEIIAEVESETEIAGLRIWPSKIEKDSNIKHIEVFYDGILHFRNDLDQEFPANVNLCFSQDKRMSLPRQESKVKFFLPENIRSLPIQPTRDISFKIIESYSHNKEDFGLNCIRFFDACCNEIHTFHERDITVEGICIETPICELFTASVVSEPWKAKCTNNIHNHINVHFPEGTLIAAIHIVNYMNNNTVNDFGIKKFRVDVNGVNRWTGKMDSNQICQGAGQVLIFLLDNHDIHSEIHSIVWPDEEFD